MGDLAEDLDGAFERLVIAYQARLYGFALRFTACSRDAEEITQDALVAAYRALRRYAPDRVRSLKLRAWLFQIAANMCRNRARRRSIPTLPLEGCNGETSGLQGAKHESPESMVEAAEESRRLAGMIACLPSRYRAAVILRHVEGLSYPELVTALGKPIGTVKSDVHRGVKLLREALRETRDER